MVKKIALGALLVGLIGVLIAGGVVRTNAKAGEGEASGYGGRGRTAEAGVTAADDGGQYGGRWAQGEEAARGGGRGRLNQDGAPATAESAPAPLADVTAAEWLTVQGTVTSVADDLVEIQTTTAETIPLEGRPLAYAQEQGLSLRVGDAVTLAGFEENGEFKIGRVTSEGRGMSVTLRDASGRPGWSGRGRRAQGG